ncbi:MAG: YggT family protein [Bacteroidota bacterium]
MSSITNSPRIKHLYRGTQIVRYLMGLIETLLGFRFILKLLGANPAAGFSSFIYRISYPLAAPFLNVFRIIQISGSVFEWTTLLAMIVYSLIAWALIKLLLMGKPVSAPEASDKLDEQGS